MAQRRFALLLCAAVALAAAPACAATTAPTLTITSDTNLNFGTIVAPGVGSRIVGADGSVSNIGVVPIGANTARPAQFTITYDRGVNNGLMMQLIFQIVLGSVPGGTVNGVQGQLSAFSTDLAGLGSLQPGQVGTFTITNCVTRVCTLTFHVGARLDVAGAASTAPLSFPLPMMVTALAVVG